MSVKSQSFTASDNNCALCAAPIPALEDDLSVIGLTIIVMKVKLLQYSTCS